MKKSGGSGEYLPWEFPLAFWMEKEGYDVSYISNVDTHADPQGLLRTKGFISVGHDEYWTLGMYDNVRKARDEGVNLAFFRRQFRSLRRSPFAQCHRNRQPGNPSRRLVHAGAG